MAFVSTFFFMLMNERMNFHYSTVAGTALFKFTLKNIFIGARKFRIYSTGHNIFGRFAPKVKFI